MTATRVAAEKAATAYAMPGKTIARDAVVAFAGDMQAASVLDLWGGGESARAFREELPDAAVISAENDSKQWAAMMMDAQLHKYGYHLGDVRDAPGRYDLIWLDMMGSASRELKALLKACAGKLNPDGALALTIMPARETDAILSGEERLRLLPIWVEQITGLKVGLFLPYRRHRNQWMWLLMLAKGSFSWWTDSDDGPFGGPLFPNVQYDLSTQGFWEGHLVYSFYPRQRALDIIEAGLKASGEFAGWYGPPEKVKAA